MSRWLPLLLLGCAERGAWDDVPMDEARLEGFDLSSIAVVVGALDGDALLVFSGPEGDGELPVHLGGPTLGVALDLSGDVEGHAGPVEIDLSGVDDPTVGDALGTYFGTAASGAAIVGGSRRRMKNGRGASFREDHFQLGISLFVGMEWVTISPGGNEDETTPPTVFAPIDSGHSGPTPPTTTPPTTTPPTTTTPTTPSTTSPTGGTTGAGEGGGCGGDGAEGGCGDGGGCDDASGCGCSHGALAPGLAWVGVLLRRRRSGADGAQRR